MWCPRNPQPPITSTLPRAFLGGIGAILAPIEGSLREELSEEVRLLTLWTKLSRTVYPSQRG